METTGTVPPPTESVFPLDELTYDDIKVLKQIGRARYPDGEMDVDHPIHPYYTKYDPKYETIVIRGCRRENYSAMVIDDVWIGWGGRGYVITHFRNRYRDDTRRPLTTIRREWEERDAYSIEFAYEKRSEKVVPIWMRVELPHVEGTDFRAEDDMCCGWDVYFKDSLIVRPGLWE